MLCVRVTRKVVNSPKRTCWERPALDIVKPMIKVAMKQTMDTNAEVSNARTIRDFSASHRLSVVICAAILLAACGHKKVQVRVSPPGALSSSDLEGLASY